MNLSLKLNVNSHSRNSVLFSALSWFGIGITAIFLMAFGFVHISALQSIYLKLISNSTFMIILVIASMLLFFLLYLGFNSLSTQALYVLFGLICLVESFFLASVFFVYANDLSKLLLIISIPTGIFALMGFLGYFQIINFSKIWPFILFLSIAVIIVGIISMFVFSEKLYILYIVASTILFSLYIGMDMWRISWYDNSFNSLDGEDDKNQIRRLGLFFGLMLIIDFVRLILLFSRLFRR